MQERRCHTHSVHTLPVRRGVGRAKGAGQREGEEKEKGERKREKKTRPYCCASRRPFRPLLGRAKGRRGECGMRVWRRAGAGGKKRNERKREAMAGGKQGPRRDARSEGCKRQWGEGWAAWRKSGEARTRAMMKRKSQGRKEGRKEGSKKEQRRMSKVKEKRGHMFNIQMTHTHAHVAHTHTHTHTHTHIHTHSCIHLYVQREDRFFQTTQSTNARAQW